MPFFCLFILIVMSSGSFAGNMYAPKTTPLNDRDVVTESADVTSSMPSNSEERKALINKIGFFYPKNSTIRHIKSINHKMYFSATYHTGGLGLRKIDDKLLNVKSGNHFILAGDSFIFGDGVSDEHTVGVKISKLTKNAHVYNFGMSGAAPNNMLALMEHFPWQSEIKEKKGIFVYNLELYYMLQRVVGSKSFLSWHNGVAPYYVLNSKGELERRGTFNDRFFITSFYRFLNSVGWLKELITDLPRISDRHVRLAMAIFKKMKSLYLAQFPQGKFIVSIGASTDPKNKELPKTVKEMLKKEEIDFIEFTPNFPKNENVLHPVFDRHYNERGYTQMALEFVEKLQKFNYLPK